MSTLSVSDTTLASRIKLLAQSGQISKGDFGLDRVTNTTDEEKPVSALQQDALNLKVSTASINQASGVAGLNASGKIDTTRLPSLSLQSSLVDVSLGSLVNNQVLTYDSALGKWQNATASGGSSSLAQNEIVIGTGEASGSVPAVLLRGPQATGSNVRAGDVILRSEGGTGSMGSGKIRFQTAAPLQMPPIPIYVAKCTNGGTTQSLSSFTLSNAIFIPAGFSSMTAILVVMCNSNTSVSGATLAGVSFTQLYTSGTTTNGSITALYLNNPANGGTRQTLVINLATASILWACLMFFENAATLSGSTGQNYAAATSSSVTVTGLQEGDFVVDFAMFRASSIPQSYTTSSYQNYLCDDQSSTYNSTTPYGFYNLSGYYVPSGQSSVNMTRSIGSSLPIIHGAFYIRRSQPASSAVPVFTDTLTLDEFGALRYGPARPLSFSETTDMSTTLFKYLTSTSPRYQFITSNTANNDTRFVVLPRAETLLPGTVFIFNCSGNSSRMISIMARSGKGGFMNYYINSAGSLLTSQFGAISGVYNGTVLLQLLYSDNYGGAWFTITSSVSIGSQA